MRGAEADRLRKQIPSPRTSPKPLYFVKYNGTKILQKFSDCVENLVVSQFTRATVSETPPILFAWPSNLILPSADTTPMHGVRFPSIPHHRVGDRRAPFRQPVA